MLLGALSPTRVEKLVVVKANDTLIGLDQPDRDAPQCRFARAAFSDYTEGLADIDLEGHVVDCGDERATAPKGLTNMWRLRAAASQESFALK